MEFRLVRLTDSDEYVQIYNEKESELVGSIIRHNRWILFQKYQLRLDGEVHTVGNAIFNRRKWSFEEIRGEIKFRWKLLGKGVKIFHKENEYSVGDFEDDKITAVTRKQRTAFIIDQSRMKSRDMIMVEDFDRMPLPLVLLSTVLIMERYHLW